MKEFVLFWCIILTCFLTTSKVIAQPNADEQIAAQYFQNKEFEKAEVYYEKLFQQTPSYLYYNSYFSCLIELKKFSKAEKIIKKLIRSYVNIPQYGVDLGYLYSVQEEKAKSETQFNDMIKGMTPNKQYIIDLANAFINRELADYAIKTYIEGKKLIKDSYPFGIELAAVYEDQKEYDKMMGAYISLIDFSPETYLITVKELMQDLISDDTEGKKSTALKNILLKNIQKNPEKTLYSEMLLWYSFQIKDFETAFIQAKSLDKRLKEDGKKVFETAQLALSNGSYDVAVKAYQYMISKGNDNYYYLNSRMELLDAKYLMVTERTLHSETDLTFLENEYIATLNELGESSATISMIKNLAHLYAFYLNKPVLADSLLTKSIKLPNASSKAIAECKTELADIYLLTGEIWEATLLYSQVEKAFKNEAIGHEAKFKNAKLSYYIGDFEWAKTQLDILKAATSKLIANDALSLSLLISDNTDPDSTTTALSYYSRADLLLFQNKLDKALITLDSVLKEFPSHPLSDEVLYKKYEIFVKKKNIDSAAACLQKIVNDYPFDILGDDALYKLANLYEEALNDRKKAMTLYEKLITDYPGSIFVAESRKKYRTLRGDNIN